MYSTDRRNFIRQGTFGATVFLAGTAASSPVIGANDRLRVAVAGLNGRGNSHISGLAGQKNVEVAWLIDPDSKVLERRANELRKRTNAKVKTATDIRKALEDPELDAVSIATPNHWHSLMTIWSAQSGKHVYVEKPMSHDVAEGRICVEAQKKYGVVIQHGTQRRSDARIAGLH